MTALSTEAQDEIIYSAPHPRCRAGDRIYEAHIHAPDLQPGKESKVHLETGLLGDTRYEARQAMGLGRGADTS